MVSGHEESAYQQAAQISGGNIGTAIRLLTQEDDLALYQTAKQLVEILLTESEYRLLQFLFTLEKDKPRLLEVLQKSKELLISLLLFKKGVPLSDNSLTELSSKITPLQALTFVDIIEETLTLARQNVSETILLSSLCAKIKQETLAG